MRKNNKRHLPAAPIPATPDLDSFPNDPLEQQLAADIETLKAVEQELNAMAGEKTLAARWLRMLGRILPQNARSARSHRVDPLPTMSAEQIQQCRQETLEHSRGHTEEAKATLQWFKDSPKDRRDQLPPWLKTKAEALADLQALLWQATPEGQFAKRSAELKEMGHYADTPLRERYDACVRFTELVEKFRLANDPDTRSRLKTEMQALADNEIAILEAMRQQPTTPAGEGTKLPKPTLSVASPFTGRWRITSMSAWEDDFLDEEVEAFIEFTDKGSGQFHFGNVQGQMDCRLTMKDGEPAVEWSWDGNAEMDAAQGRGWAVLKDDELHGMIFFHGGDDSEFVAKKKGGSKRAKR